MRGGERLAIIFLVVMGMAILFGPAACTPKQVHVGQPVTSPPGADVSYSYVRVGELYHVLAANDRSYRAAMQEICGKNVCQVAQQGEYYIIQVTAP